LVTITRNSKANTASKASKRLPFGKPQSKNELKSLRQDFWRSCTSDHRQVWLALREAAETDAETTRLLLQVAEIFTEKDSMMVCLDSTGVRYELPAFVINDPVSYFNGLVHRKKRRS